MDGSKFLKIVCYFCFSVAAFMIVTFTILGFKNGIRSDEIIYEKIEKIKDKPKRVTLLITGNSRMDVEKNFVKKLEEYPDYSWFSEMNGSNKDEYYKRVTLMRD